jgi:hypothetical protein
MELDHLFILSREPEQVCESLQAFGLTEGAPNVHPRQGTACRRFFFQNAYFEVAWVINEEEVKGAAIAKTKLWERSQHHLTGYCPFGICFRTTNHVGNSIAILFDHGWRYHSPYLPEGQFANIASNQDFPAEPMLFEMPFFALAPKDYPQEKQQPLNHKKGFKEITRIALTLPATDKNSSSSMKKVLTNSIVAASRGDTYKVTMEFDYCKKGKTKDFNPIVPLSIKW